MLSRKSAFAARSRSLTSAHALVRIAAVLAGVDPAARTIVASTMIDCAHDLDRDVVSPAWQ
jgi:hypothetical protein